jgi:hypothetical protein
MKILKEYLYFEIQVRLSKKCDALVVRVNHLLTKEVNFNIRNLIDHKNYKFQYVFWVCSFAVRLDL